MLFNFFKYFNVYCIVNNVSGNLTIPATKKISLMEKENNFTTYSLLCQTPTEDDKIYYWENMEQLFPILNNLFVDFATSKILSFQHFEKLTWNKNENRYRRSSSIAPTGGCINWSYENLKKTFNLYLVDKTFHYHMWDIHKGVSKKILSDLPLNPRGYIFHYSTTFFGDRLKLQQDKNLDWYNRITDFRFQIQYNFNQLSALGINQIVDITFRENFLTEKVRDKIVINIFSFIFGKYLMKRKSIKNYGFTQTFEKAYLTERETLNEWKQIFGVPIKFDK